ncbi:hypothetical protein [Sphaerisporangium fuscum]|uniref:hypothetical protein n=1 Tax=Sphaerisporangium fuscum TaxID=2835868 RepID=UPI001BDBDB46|nr:hypothetical protein [Sphaerisporangium fuscum]
MNTKKLWAVGLAVAAGCAGLGTVAAASASQAAPAPHKADFTGYQLVTLPNANVPNFQRRVVYCPPGKRAVGGGGEARGNGAILVGSFPTDQANGWIVLGRQDGYGDVGISAFVICANAS